MRGHIRDAHPSQFGISTNQAQIRFTKATGPDGGEVSTQLFNFNEKTYRDELAKLVCAKHLSHRFADDVVWENFLQRGVNPAVKKVSRSTVSRDIDRMVLEWKKELCNTFSQLGHKVSICSDIWSDHWQEHHYMGITCHWIDDSWTLHKRLIAYREFDTVHSAQNISMKIRVILQEYGLVQKLFSVSFDNASANTASLDSLIATCQPSFGGRFFHVRCICHIINLCVQDGLACLKDTVAPIKSAISYLCRHSSLLKRWKRFCRENHLTYKKFTLDVSTRWNSTYKMLHGSYEFKEHLCAFFTSISNEVNLNFYIYPQLWDTCSSLCALLAVFNNATNELSGVYYPTSCLALDQCLNIVIALNEHSEDELLQQAIVSMKAKWMKYFTYLPDIFLVAKVLDPRVRVIGLEELLTMYYDNLFPSSDDSKPDARQIVGNIHQLMRDLYREYKIEYGNIDEPCVGVEGGSGSGGSGSQAGPRRSNKPYKSKAFEIYYAPKKQNRGRISTNPYQELDTYLTNRLDYGEYEGEDEQLNFLGWWAHKGNSFPILSIIAKEVLACPVSTVAVEQAFSMGSLTLSEKRSRLTVEHLENQCLLDDWVRAANRTQEDHDSTDSNVSTTDTEV